MPENQLHELVPIPIERIRREFMRAAGERRFGSVELEIALTPEASARLDVLVRHKDSVRGAAVANPPTNVGTDRERQAMVETALHNLGFRAGLRQKLWRIVGHFSDGKLMTWEFEGER